MAYIEEGEILGHIMGRALSRVPGECWPYRGPARLQFRCKMRRPARIVWMLTRGDPGKLIVKHSCGTLTCVNPEHLVLERREAAANAHEMFKGGPRKALSTGERLSHYPDSVVVLACFLVEQGNEVDVVSDWLGVPRRQVLNWVLGITRTRRFQFGQQHRAKKGRTADSSGADTFPSADSLGGQTSSGVPGGQTNSGAPTGQTGHSRKAG